MICLKKTIKKLMMEKRPGYSIMEIMLVLTIVATLLVSILQVYRSLEKRNKINAAKTIINTVKAGVDNFRVDIGRYPTKIEELVVPPSDPQEKKRWQRGYVPKEYAPDGSTIIDPWGNPIMYELKPNKVSFDLKSWGPDGNGAETGNIYALED